MSARLIKNINPEGSSSPNELISINGIVFFAADQLNDISTDEDTSINVPTSEDDEIENEQDESEAADETDSESDELNELDPESENSPIQESGAGGTSQSSSKPLQYSMAPG